MWKFTKFNVVALISALIAGQVAAADTPFATVNGVVIQQATADLYRSHDKNRDITDSPETDKRLREDLINRELMFQAAQQAGFDKNPEVVSQVDSMIKKLLAQIEATKQVLVTRAFIEDYFKKHPVTDAQLKETYDAYRAKGGNTEYKVRHILLKSEPEARDIISKLDKGAKFEDLARQSIDTGTQVSGGDLGWSSPAKFSRTFAEELVRLGKGSYSKTPVKTEYGFHVIKLEDTRPLKVPSFEEMKHMLQKDAQEMQLNKMIATLRSKAKIQ